jgi:hypothetical protein
LFLAPPLGRGELYGPNSPNKREHIQNWSGGISEGEVMFVKGDRAALVFGYHCSKGQRGEWNISNKYKENVQQKKKKKNPGKTAF